MTTRTPLTDKEKEREVRMMRTPQLWPLPYLPIKRYVDGSTGEAVTSVRLNQGPQCGFIMWDKDLKPVPRVYLANSVGVGVDKTPLSQIPTKKYESFEALVDDGWVVD